MRRVIPILVLCSIAVGCEPDARNDANLFIDRIEVIDLDDPVEDRRERVDALAALPLASVEVQTARDACVEAHRAILEAEDLHARARAAVVDHADEGALSITERQRIENDIQQSNRAIARSRDLFSRCHRLTRDLDLRYRSRRHRSQPE